MKSIRWPGRKGKGFLRSREGLLAITTLVLLVSCRPLRQGNDLPAIQLLHTWVIPHGFRYEGTTVGGLSGIDYHAESDLYYLISDDRSALQPARFYTARIPVSQSRIDTVAFQSVHFFRRPDGSFFPNAKQLPAQVPDPEAIRLHPLKGEVWWTSEGDRVLQPDSLILLHPALCRATPAGKVLDSFPLPANMLMQTAQQGPRRNGAWEGLSFARGFSEVWVAMEEPLLEDGDRAGLGDSTGITRWTCWDAGTGRIRGQYAYPIDAVVRPPQPEDGFRVNGVVEILWWKDTRFFVLERSFSSGHPGSSVRLYLADLGGATDVSNRLSLWEDRGYRPIRKRLLLDLDTLPFTVHNIEGLCFGPRLADGRFSLLLLADDNFSPAEQSQVLLFALSPR
jgi:hypothetical protein